MKHKPGTKLTFDWAKWSKQERPTSARFTVEVLNRPGKEGTFYGKVLASNVSGGLTGSNSLGSTAEYIDAYFKPDFERDSRGRFANKLKVDALKFKALADTDSEAANAFLDTLKGSEAVKVFVKANLLRFGHK